MPEYTFKFFKLDWRKVRHFSGHHLVLEESHFADNCTAYEVELVTEFVIGISRKIILLDVGFFTFCGKSCKSSKILRERREIGMETPDMGELISDVARESSYCE